MKRRKNQMFLFETEKKSGKGKILTAFMKSKSWNRVDGFAGLFEKKKKIQNSWRQTRKTLVCCRESEGEGVYSIHCIYCVYDIHKRERRGFYQLLPARGFAHLNSLGRDALRGGRQRRKNKNFFQSPLSGNYFPFLNCSWIVNSNKKKKKKKQGTKYFYQYFSWIKFFVQNKLASDKFWVTFWKILKFICWLNFWKIVDSNFK